MSFADDILNRTNQRIAQRQTPFSYTLPSPTTQPTQKESGFNPVSLLNIFNIPSGAVKEAMSWQWPDQPLWKKALGVALPIIPFAIGGYKAATGQPLPSQVDLLKKFGVNSELATKIGNIADFGIDIAVPSLPLGKLTFPLLKGATKNLPWAKKVAEKAETFVPTKAATVPQKLEQATGKISNKVSQVPISTSFSKGVPLGTKSLSENLSPTEIEKLKTLGMPQAKSIQYTGKISSAASKLSLASEKEIINRVIEALRKAKPLSSKQKALITKEKGQRVMKAIKASKNLDEQEALQAQLKALKGEYSKIKFEPLNISQKDMTELFKIVNSKTSGFFEQLNAKLALKKMFEGKLPTSSEQNLLRNIFPEELLKEIQNKAGLFEKVTNIGAQIINIPRAIMASMDFSAPFRQGLLLISHPVRFFRAFPTMIKALSKKGFEDIQKSIREMPTFDLMKKYKLALTDTGGVLGLREEAFMSSWAEKIPGVGATSRAYTAFLNKIRADVFQDLVRKSEKLGLDLDTSYQSLKIDFPGLPKSRDLGEEIAFFVNAASGRGSLGNLERAAVSLNSILFSPRLIASRLIFLNPTTYVKASPLVRREALKSLLTLASLALTITSIAKMGGADVETDPRSADFAKIKVGNTRFDILGGFQQYIRFGAQLICGKYISTTTGREISLGEGYRPLTRLDILVKQLRSKLAPVPAFIANLLQGKDVSGQPIDVPLSVAQMFIPMLWQDLYEIAKEDPSLLPSAALLGELGVGVQNYGKSSASSVDNVPIVPNIPANLLKVPDVLRHAPIPEGNRPLPKLSKYWREHQSAPYRLKETPRSILPLFSNKFNNNRGKQ